MSRNTTSFSTTPDSLTSPNFIPVTTTTGFNQGDLVFLNGNDYQSFRPQTASASFSINGAVPVLSGVNGGFGGSLGHFGSTTNTSGASYVQNVAKLSNGNIVAAGVNNSNAAYFTIYNPDFTVAVSKVTLPASFGTGYASVGVTALTGGGFVIYFTGTSSYFTYAVYTNNGTVTTALTQNSNVVATGTNYVCQVTALSGGGFVAAAFNSSYAATYAIFNAAGTQQYTGSVAGGNLYGGPVMLAAGASNSFVMMFMASTNADWAWRHISSTNTTLNSGLLSFSSASYSSGYFSATTLDDGITVVLAYNTYASSAYRIGLVTYNTSTNTLGTPVTYTTPNSTNFNSICVRQLPSGNFLLALQTSAGQDMYQCMYATFNSSCVPIGAPGVTATDPIFKSMGWQRPNSFNYQFNTAISVLTLGSTIYIFYANDASTGNTAFTGYYTIDSSTYNYTSSASAPSIISPYEAATNVAVGGAVASTLTPTKTAYTPLGSSATTARTATFTATSPSPVVSQASVGYDVATLTTGNFVIAYASTSSPYAVTANVYSPSRALVASVAISTSSYGGTYCVRVAPLSSGKFVVVYATSTSALNFAVVSSSYGVTASGTLSGLSMGLSGIYAYQTFAVSDLTGDRFVITALDSATSYPKYYVYSSAGSQLTSGNITNSAYNPNAIRGLPGGGFAVAVVVNASSSYLYQFSELSANNFTSLSTSPYIGLQGGNGSNFNVNYALHVTPQNQTWFYSLFPTGGSGTGATRAWFASANQAASTDIALGSTVPIMLCPTSIGTPVGLYLNGGGSDIVGYLCNVGSYASYGTLNGIRCDTNAALGGYYPYLRAVPYIGNTVLLVYNDALNSNYLSFTVITAPNYSGGAFIANTTQSAVSSFATPNYPLVGVAANTAAAGGVGQLQTNGTAVLNSNYSASTPAQAFDYQTPSGLGVRGTISGRTVTLLGN